MRWTDHSPRQRPGLFARAVSWVLLLVPTAVLGFLAYHLDAVPLAAGAGVQALFVLVFVRAHPVWRPPVSASLIVLYIVALGWAWLPTRHSAEWVVHLAQGFLLVAAVGLFAMHDLTRTGAEPLRRANKWSRRLAGRAHWPVRLADCRTLPEVAALRASVRDEPGPALALLSDPRTQVVVAALGALEYRPHWRPGEAELVLKTAQRATDPAVRVAAAYALAGVTHGELIAGLAAFLRDHDPEVRRAAAEAVLWEADHRWPFARDGVREALADPRLESDGPLPAGAARLPAAAVADLVTWAGEPPPLAQRAIATLIEHHDRALTDADRPELASELAAQMLDPDTPPGLRVELAALLRDHHLLTPDLLDRLTNPDQPGPMRLFAAEVMLRVNPNDPDGIDVLRGLARQPNRELAVQVGGILQNVLGLELGLPPGGELPAPNSKAAADVARRVMAWANGATPEMVRPTPGPQAGVRPGTRPSIPGLQQTGSVLPPDPFPRRGSSAVF